ncbi:conjugative transposon protein TraM [Salegentibacter mishustinae]|uniref:Conjugative transposon protein TraM n=1 Tax=Zunongwangia pacifica TaxID=2911062 RepID=A0A9X1ZY95_9FLAO|nr:MULTISPECIES: conjugative transposon protein TraM [Bacteroidota]MCL6218621.1 conjugative transposon protein TraM [Zunongwangia pacifica]UBZ07678.1 conjugative transposon protein TraM [Salegentibacter mishustinae]|tara:strand:+ start:2986 stop:3915 length:930 start_codon:yes stop_codon:yes gene_type:complete
MKIEKNKIVFASVFAVVIIFLISYSIMVMGNDESEPTNLKETSVPALEEDQKEYDSKLDAINDLKEVRETNAPSIYDEKLIDSLGFYDENLPEREKERIVDSIYATGRIKYSQRNYQHMSASEAETKVERVIDSHEIKMEQKIAAKEMGLEHQLFFASDPKENEISVSGTTDDFIYAVVDGDQVVKANSRLRMRLSKAATINRKHLPKNTPIYGFISFQPNRVLIEIENIKHHPTNLKAFDLQDGSEGIYVENNFRAQVSTEVIGDMVDDINIAGIPQVSGFKKIFQRNNRNIKVTVLNNYRLILKPKL